MASKAPLRSLAASAASSLWRPAPCPRLSSSSSSTLVPTSACAFATASRSSLPEADSPANDRPRWQQTPVRMVAPVRVRPLPRGPVFKANEDPGLLDAAYVKMLGKDGDKVLSDEVKWLAVTHKSFDHGRRGHNDRLAFLGRRIVSLQTSQALLNSPQAEAWPKDGEGRPVLDEFGRAPYLHPALDGLAGLSQESKNSVLEKSRLSQLAQRYGIDRVTRWKPRRPERSHLHESGLDSVCTMSLYAIVGAIALERGGQIANQVTQEKILAPLGFSFTSQL